ncbi:translation initiation factor 2 [Phytohabitans sp. LJ34]|uniref:translation initiation factor 2 n=1 Tax=Phytohabitans sp. LJ34 TaxID=3452217 RepID=UPI003F89A68B
MTTRNGGPADDEFWRRPADGSTPPPPAPPPTEPAPPAYPGPPPSAPPPRGWRPPIVMQPAAPRELPRQDSVGIDEEERSARTLTYGIGMIAAAVLVVVVCLLCSRALF